MASHSQQAELPSVWAWCQVRDVGEAILGRQRSPATEKGPDLRPYLRVANVQEDHIDLDDLAQMDFPPANRERFKLRPADVLLCEGQSRELVGRAAMYHGEVSELYFQNTLVRFRAHEGVNPEYALLVFRMYLRDGTFASVATSTTNLAHLGLGRFQRLPFPLPPAQVQEVLAELVRAAQTEIDYVRARLRSAESYATALIERVRDFVILGGIVNLTSDDRPILRRGWVWRTTSDIVPEDAPIVYGILQPGPNITDGTGVPYIRGLDIQDGQILTEQLRSTNSEIATRYERSSLQPGDVLVGLVRHPRVAVVPPELEGANITQGSARLRPSHDIDSGFLAHWLSSGVSQRWLMSRMRGIDMPGLNLRDVRQLPVPVPPLGVQRTIAEVLDQAAEESQRVSSAVRAAQHSLASVESRLLVEAVYGVVAGSVTAEVMRTSNPLPGEALLQQIKDEQSTFRRDTTSTDDLLAPGSVEMADGQEPTRRRSILEVLGSAERPFRPEELFAGTGIEERSVDEFYEELRAETRAGNVIIERPDDSRVFIRLAQ